MKHDIKFIYECYRKHSVVSTDTRNLPEGCLFFALKGANFNGNTYAIEALNKGASWSIVDEEAYAQHERTILVNDVLETLQELANYHRRQLKIPVIGITGSNGKTTSKELIREVLAVKYKVLATQGNLNNHIGVPLTLLSIKDEHEAAIIEMGANHGGEIALLSKIAEPAYGLITNIGKAHIEGFGGYEGVIKAKKELYEFVMAHEGTLFVNGDDPLLMELTEGYAKRITYGGSYGDVEGKLLSSAPFIEMEWIDNKGSDHRVKTNLFGKYNFYNIMAALCIGMEFGVDPEAASAAIAAYTPSNNRSQLIKTAVNTIYMDAYNANPTSMKMAIESFVEVNAENKLVILGDMLELGMESQREHQQIVDMLKDKQIGKVALVGECFSKTDTPAAFRKFPTNRELTAWLDAEGITNSHVLIKGSRGIKLEVALEHIS